MAYFRNICRFAVMNLQLAAKIRYTCVRRFSVSFLVNIKFS